MGFPMTEMTDDQFMSSGSPPPTEMNDDQFMNLGTAPTQTGTQSSNVDSIGSTAMKLIAPLAKAFLPDTPSKDKVDAAQAAMSNPDTSVASRLTGYGANVADQVPLLGKAGSVLAAIAGAGQGDTFDKRLNDLQDSQAAMRQVGEKSDPGATMLGKASANVLQTAPLIGLIQKELGAGKSLVPAITDSELSQTYNVQNPSGRPAIGSDKLLGFDSSGAQNPWLSKKIPDEQSRARDIIAQAAKIEGINPSDVANNLDTALQTGKPITALDVLTKEKGGVTTQGKNFVGLTKAAATFPGEASSLSGDVSARGINAADRIAGDFDSAISGNPFYGVKDQIGAQQKLSAPLYKAFYEENPSMQSPLIDNILDRPAGQRALKEVAEDMQNSATRMAVPDPDLLEQAKDAGLRLQNGVGTGLKGQTLDYVKQNLDAQAQAAKRAYLNGNGTKREWNNLSQMAADLRNEMDALDVTAQAGPNSLNPAGGAYARARANSAQAFQMDDALEQGRNFMQQDPEEIRAFMTDKNTALPQRASYLSGVRRALQDTADAKNAGANPIAAFTKPAVTKRLQAALGEQGNVQQLLDNLNLESTMARVNGIHSGGSDTMMKSNYGDMLNKQPSNIVGRVFHAVSSPATAAANEGVNFLSGVLKKSAQNMDQKTAAEIMRYMTTSNPELWRSLAVPKQATGGRVGYKSGGKIDEYSHKTWTRLVREHGKGSGVKMSHLKDAEKREKLLNYAAIQRGGNA